MTRDMATPLTLVLQVPFRLVERSRRKEIHLPSGAHLHRDTDDAMVRVLARILCWKRLLDQGEFATIADPARQEVITLSYVTRILRLTVLAPDIVKAILDGCPGSEISLGRLQEGFLE